MNEGLPVRNHTDQQLRDLVFEVSQSMNLKEPPADRQVESLSNFLKAGFGNLTDEQIRAAFVQAAAGRLGELSEFASLSTFFWGKVLGSYEKRLQENKAHHSRYEHEHRGMTPDEMISTGTQAKIHNVLSEIANRKTSWLNERVRPSLSHKEMYDLKCRDFAMRNAERFGGYDNARKAWELRIDRRRWNESKDLNWVDVELAKLAE